MQKTPSTEDSQSILVLGASARAAAHSVGRAGYRVAAADCFGDEDLREVALVRRINHYPQDFGAAAGTFPPGPWLYVGGLENHPELVAALAARRQLLGNGPDVLRRVRDPRLVHEALAAAGIASPAVVPANRRPPDGGRWMLKSQHSSGGNRVRPWLPKEAAQPKLIETRPDWYLQQRVRGVSCGAVYVAAGGDARLIGLTRQRLGRWPGDADTFRYSGSVGPLPVQGALRSRLIDLGKSLSAVFELQGLFGVDVVVDGQCPQPVEVNPRYTASVEVLERALGVSLIQWHVEACCQRQLPSSIPPARCVVGKAIVWTRAACRFPEDLWRRCLEENRAATWPNWADIPAPRSLVPAGGPMMSVLAEAFEEPEVERILREREAEVLRR